MSQFYFKKARFYPREFLYVLLVFSGEIKLYLHLLNAEIIDFTLLVALVLSTILMVDLSTNSLPKKISKFQFFGIGLLCSLYCLAGGSLLFTPSSEYAYLKFASFSIAILLYIYPLLNTNFSCYKFFDYFLTITSVLLLIYLVQNLVLGSEVVRQGDMSINYLTAGYMCGVLILILISGLSKKKWLLFPGILTLIISGARGPILFTFLASLICLWRNMKLRKLFLSKNLIFILIGMLFLGGGLNNNDTLSSMLTGSLGRVNLLFQSDKGSSVDVRVMHIVHSIDYISQNYIQGYGLGSYGIITTGKDQRAYPHNAFLEVWFELGLLGIGLFILFIVFHLWRTYKNFDYGALGILTYIILNSMKSSSFVEEKLLYAFFSIFLSTGYLAYKKQQDCNSTSA